MPMPPVSTISKRKPSRSTSCSRRSRVTPGVGSTMAMGSPTRRLNRLDLPTMGRPKMAMDGIMWADRWGWRLRDIATARGRGWLELGDHGWYVWGPPGRWNADRLHQAERQGKTGHMIQQGPVG